MSKPKYRFEIYPVKGRDWYWRLSHRNGNIVADGGEGYKRKGALLRSLGRLLAQIKLGAYDIEEVE